MSISPLSSVSTSPARAFVAERLPAAPSFEQTLRAAGRGADVDRAREAAEQLVSTTFIQPVLAMLRGSGQAAEPFAPGAAERRFGPLLDERIADHVVHGARFPLVDRVVEQLLVREASTPGPLPEDAP